MENKIFYNFNNELASEIIKNRKYCRKMGFFPDFPEQKEKKT